MNQNFTTKIAAASAVISASVAASSSAALIIIHQKKRQREQKILKMSENHGTVYRYRDALPIPIGEEFNLALFNDVFCCEFFRFTADVIYVILPYLGLEDLTYRYRYQCPAETAFCLVLYRLSFPNRYKDDM
ncbi:hypothetical protein EDC01DRAFT_632635 [Geopyxis carbonaria]|nr:hypothetical protein EDC01DRAFT_632635 [Geopyxis carbonaria]